MLLLEKEPGFVAALELAVNVIDGELSDEGPQARTTAELRDRLGPWARRAV
jgi:hypothetical protein